MSKYKEIDLGNLQRYSTVSRPSKVDSRDFAQTGDISMLSFLDSLPNILKAKDLRELIESCRKARSDGKAIIIGVGGHIIKCGLAPLLIELMRSGYLSCIVTNGSVAIHDYEIAMYGSTSEDVNTALADGSFGMAIETCDGINAIVKNAYKRDLGYGEAVGEYLLMHGKNTDISLFAQAFKFDVPICVQVAMGTDIVHQHASADGAAIGATSLKDFRILCNMIPTLDEGGVYINFGSAVILPEVFLKALTVARNISGKVEGFTTAVFDMNIHYRPLENVIRRPTANSGKGYYFVGHHEIMIPLFIHSLLHN